MDQYSTESKGHALLQSLVVRKGNVQENARENVQENVMIDDGVFVRG